ncbi:MAG: alpha/beta fold hydrolase, partial [Myxococcota bacterium]
GNPNAAAHIVVAVHGRGASAESITHEARAIVGDDPNVAIIAPQATGACWYGASYRAKLDEFGDALPKALAAVNAAVAWAAERVGRANVHLVGFSQGACLSLEWLSRQSESVGSVVALSGARLGPAERESTIGAGAEGVRVILGLADGDPWVDMADVQRSAQQFEGAGANVTLLAAPPGPHAVRPLERIVGREAILGAATGPTGFDNHHHVEALPGAVPADQNSPHHAPYGLWPEQINGTGFVAPRAANRRSWAYRVRPAAQHTPLTPLDHPTLDLRFTEGVDPNLAAWPAPGVPDAPMDFVDGLITVGGAGSPEMRRGFAVHLYAANRSMNGRAYWNADSELLIVPQEGRLRLLTDFGVLQAAPGQVVVLPRGVRVSVLLEDGTARGYVGEIFGRQFELPGRGPVGANGLTDARHFQAPAPWHEDRLHPGYRLACQFGGRLFEAQQDFSPYDVVGWHGNLTPLVYDLMNFSPVGNTRFDHGDPSVYTVLSAPLDETGSHLLDLVFFPPRWDATEHTFRPPYFHRNATTEINGIIADPGLGAGSPFEPGGIFLTPSMTPHGVVARSVEHFLAATEEKVSKPHRIPERSMWFQFESALPMRLTPWAREAKNRHEAWTDIWGVYRDHYEPHGD